MPSLSGDRALTAVARDVYVRHKVIDNLVDLPALAPSTKRATSPSASFLDSSRVVATTPRRAGTAQPVFVIIREGPASYITTVQLTALVSKEELKAYLDTCRRLGLDVISIEEMSEEQAREQARTLN